MRVFAQVLILGGLLSALAPAPASAAPILLPSGDSGGSCLNVLGVANSNCGLFSLGALSGETTLDIQFDSDSDVALFEFLVGADLLFFAQTTSDISGLDSILGLFDSAGTLYTYGAEGSQARGADIDPFGNFNDQLGGFTLAGGTSYYLAVLLNPMDGSFTNGFSGTPDSLAEGFACDLAPECQGGGGTFALSLTAQPQPVPEPGTFALFGTGAFAALVRRRSRKRHEREDVAR